MNLLNISEWVAWARKNPKAGLAAGVALAIVSALFLAYPNLPLPIPDPEVVTAPQDRMGWAGAQEANQAWEEVKGDPGFVPFRLAGPPQDNSGKRVCLFDAVRKVNGGKDIENINQEIGDCVSWGMRNALVHLLAVQILSGEPLSFHDFDTAYIYGISRVQIGGGRLSGDGSTGAWAVAGGMKFGDIPYLADGLAPYSGARARQWGRKPGVPQKYIDLGVQHLIRSAAKVKSAAEVRDAICNGYPVTIASDWGGQRNLNVPLPVKDGRAVCPHQDSWGHQMCIIAYDGTASQPYFFVINSWGPGIYAGVSPDGSPKGGFWVTTKDVEYIVAQDDSFAISAWAGFPVPPIDWSKLDEARAIRQLPAAPQHWEDTIVCDPKPHYALAP